ncbi:hypothetical protein DXX93_19505 [Thalassotalea euphylliae]|uniref:Uncharacterized protein n=1 Tax=Thalassotalea euphylliae TaxID=1655234 RepID=A0A3E0TV32_9GAMM|nr:hypothetical protein [Thalassotalea euphylliae]REL28536.1 hypothetical protein DXX93_19505 [Thalassotalea euphylliae]
MTYAVNIKPITAKKLSVLLIAAVALFVFAAGMASTAFVIQQRSLAHINQEQLPRVYGDFNQLVKISRLIESLNKVQLSSAVPAMVEQHTEWAASAKLAFQSLRANRLQFSALEALINFDRATLNRLSENANRNAMLTQLAIERVEVALALLANSRDQQPLALNTALRLLKTSLEAIAKQPVPLEQASITAQIEQLSQWLALQRANGNRNTSNTLVEAIRLLVGIFTDEHALFGKWQGQQRLYGQFNTQVEQAIAELINYREQLSRNNAINGTRIDPDAAIRFRGYSVLLSDAVVWLASLAAGFFIIALILVSRLHKRHHQRLDQLVGFTSAVLSDQNGTYLQQVVAQTQQGKITEQQRELAKALTTRLSHTYSQAYVDNLQARHRASREQLALCAATWQWRCSNGVVDFSQRLSSSLLAQLSAPDELSFSLRAVRRAIGKENFHRLLEASHSATELYQSHSLPQPQSCLIALGDGVYCQVKITYREGQWSGTLVDQTALHTKINTLKKQLTGQKNSLEEQRQSSIQGTSSDYQALSKMLIQGALQSQGMMLSEADTSTQSVNDKALLRALSRLDELQTMAMLSTQQRNREAQDIDVHQLNAAIIANLNREFISRKHSVAIFHEDNIHAHVNLDVDFYTRLLTGFSNLMLAGLHKQQLLIKLAAIDQTKGQQTWQLSFALLTPASAQTQSSQQACSQPLADLIKDPSSQHCHHTRYCQQMLTALRGQLVTIKQQATSVELVLNLPVALLDVAENTPASTRLTHAKVLVLSAQTALAESISLSLASTKVECQQINNMEAFYARCSAVQIKQRKVDAVVVCEGLSREYSAIDKHIKSLADKVRPFVVLLQDKPHNLATTGLHALTARAITPTCLQATIAQGLTGKTPDTALISADTLSPHQFVHTHVALLLAVKQVERHQALINLLTWLGFQVTLVVDAVSMHNHWRSGRFLVLINEFTLPRELTPLVGQGVTRGVFTLSNSEQSTAVEQEQVAEKALLQETEEQQDKHQDFAKSWHVATVAGGLGDLSGFDLDGWMQRLSPWLITRSVGTKIPHVTSTRAAHTPAGTGLTGLAFASQLDELMPAAFDLANYAQNQGSAELAAFMIDDYIEQLVIIARQLTEQVKYEDNQTLLATLADMSVIAHILSAQGLVQLSLQFEHALKNQSNMGIERILGQMKREIVLIKQYADAI